MEKRKRKLNIKRLLVFLLILYIFGSFLFTIITYPIKNIYVINNNILSDQEVIDIAGIREYPSILLTTKGRIRKKLLKNSLIKSVIINKSISGKVTLIIEENKPLFYDLLKKQSVLSNGKYIDQTFDIPILINTMPKEVYEKLIESFNKIDQDVFFKLSEIEYAKTEQDDERFLIKTTDKIKIYVNIRRFEDINYYNELLSTLDNKTGTWYLDYGNYFESDR